MVKAKLNCAGASDPGRVRRNNEDAFHLDPERGFFVVVDGVGGQAAGEKAAAIAIERIRARLDRQTGTPEQRMREAITVANNEIFEAALSNEEWNGMACVLTAVIVENGSAIIGHVGDSRLYQIRAGAIRKLTHDHSPVGEREDQGELTEAEAMRHPRRNEVFRDVGSEKHAPDDADFIEVLRVPFEPDSALLLCSDGLSDQAPSDAIRGAVEANAGNPAAAVRELIDAANRAGGKDNVTVVVIEGETFASASGKPTPSPAGRHWALPAAMLACGIVLTLAAAWVFRSTWVPAPRIIAPQLLRAGAGTPLNINQALSEARAGDIVEVEPGEYREQIRLKSGVVLRARNSRGVILRAAVVGDGPAVVAEDITGARLSGFRILADEQAPLGVGILMRNAQVEIDDTEVSGAATCTEISGVAGPSISGSDFSACGFGVLFSGASQATLSHNRFQGNRNADITAQSGARPILIENVFETRKNGLTLPPELPMKTVRERNVFVPPTASAARGGAK